MISRSDTCLLLGDCLELLPKLCVPVDMVLCDMPYGVTHCNWDEALPLNLVWEYINKIVKLNGVFALFGSEPFSTKLRSSNLDNYKYDWIWVKNYFTNHLNCKKQPMRQTENISVFYRKQCTYILQLHNKEEQNIRLEGLRKRKDCELYNSMSRVTTRSIPEDKVYPDTLLYFNRTLGNGHPSEKPVSLLEYLIKTYTNEEEIVLDFTMGSGSTGVACVNTNRKFIGIEKEERYFNLAKRRIYSAIASITRTSII